MKISILHPSYGRPELALQCYNTWMDRADNKEDIEYIICLSLKDAKLPEYEAIFDQVNCCAKVIADNGLVKQANAAAEISTGNLLIAISDDFDCPEHWDTILNTALEGCEDYCVKTQDGLQPFIQTLPMMDRKFYERFNYIYHPAYFHMYGDEELAEVGKLLNRTITLPDYFRHNHYSTGINPKDAVNEKNDSFYMVDKETFLKRKENKFHLVMLEILIPTIPARAEYFNRVFNDLLKYSIGANALVRISTLDSEGTIGHKRNVLLQSAVGEYVCFFDDDDTPAEHYVYSIMSALHSNPDCCSLHGIITTDGQNPRRFIHSIEYDSYFEKDEIYYRPPNHLNVIKRTIAQQFKFPEINFGEDTDWAMQIANAKVLKTEAKINETLYYYKYISNK